MVVSSSKVVAVVPAAGSGERLAAGVPKAFCELDGRTLLERAVGGLLESGVVDHVVAAVPADRIDQAKRLLAERATVVAGGADRTVEPSRVPAFLMQQAGIAAEQFCPGLVACNVGDDHVGAGRA